MKVTGTGSRSSPIAIDDSEDEVLLELVGDERFASPPPPITDQRVMVPQNGAQATVSGAHYQDPTFEGDAHLFALDWPPQTQSRVTGKKRKRSHSGAQMPVAGPSQKQMGRPMLDVYPAVMSKKALKKKRKKERAAAENQLPQPQTWANGANYFIPELAATQTMSSWGTFGAAPQMQPLFPDPYTGFNATFPPQHEMPNSYNGSSSSWVESMALAADMPMEDIRGRDVQKSHAHPSTWPQHLDHNSHQATSAPAPPSLPPVPPPAPALAPPALPPAPLPPVPSHPPQPIGMKPEQDPASKHGLFSMPLVSKKAAASKESSYLPNPARTLVMEQLPKQHRTQEFVNKWSKTACGVHPVFSCVDYHASKALIEFATAELARKAWASPKLGASLVGLKTHEMKGRPREDLIKVWWYRVDGIGANAGVGEIEEGEIEGDAAEKEVEVPVKKETKKEKKARLARERQAKKLAAAAANPPMTPSTLSSPASATSLPIVTPKEAIVPQPYPLPPDLSSFAQAELPMAYPYYAILPQPLPHPLPQLAPVPLPKPKTRAPLLPQSALETQWRSQHELPKKPNRDIITSTASHSQQIPIASITKPQSRPQQLPKLSAPQPTVPASLEYEDMDVEEDMILESPQTGRRSSFDLSSVPPIQDHQPPMEPELDHAIPKLSGTLGVSSTTLVDAPSEISSSVPPNDGHNESVPPSTFEPNPSRPESPSPPAIISPSPSSGGSGTPPLEPRAMKNAPKGPSFAKRSLLARQKELEERIARTKQELGITINAPAPPPGPNDIPTPTTESPLMDDEESKQAMEERLRMLVLRSQRNRSKGSAPVTPSTDAPGPLSTTATRTQLSNMSASVNPPPSVSTKVEQAFSLDDLAVSFITETIETFKAAPHPPTPTIQSFPLSSVSRTTSSTASAAKLELAAKQKRLEAQIAQSKILMAKLGQARTKQERETILTAIREHSRASSMSDVVSSDSVPTPAITTGAAPTPPIPQVALSKSTPHPFALAGHTHLQLGPAVPAVKKWPGSDEHVGAGVLIVSDDEEDEESDGD
ncbi:hypothetical protein H0H92_010402 [Tricholoma furcatifolium]|nr:hypothetical protein H0H92_010402 [Tricholoma furcatifolium]